MNICECGCHTHSKRPHVRCWYCNGYPDWAPSVCYRIEIAGEVKEIPYNRHFQKQERPPLDGPSS